MEIAGQAAIVTGGASGLGATTAHALAERGMKVYAFDLGQSIESAQSHAGIEYLEVNVTDHDAIRAAMATIASGDEALRVVVNCAGIGTPGRILSRKEIGRASCRERVESGECAGYVGRNDADE